MRRSEPLSEGHPSNPSAAEQPTSEEFQFLYCQSCNDEAKCPKLLPCLHSLCSGCLEQHRSQCSICNVPGAPDTDQPVLDNIFFESLQRHLSLHRQVVDEKAACTRCKNPAHFWCSQCEQLLCPRCCEAHGYYLKHETQRLEEVRAQPVRQFLQSMRKTNNIFCSHHRRHSSPMPTSIYCRGCAKALCCSCVILDGDAHKDLRCDISEEIEQRQDELDSMTQELQEQEVAFKAAQAQMSTAVSQLGQVRTDMEKLIHSRISQVLAYVREQEHSLLEAVNQSYQRDYDAVAGRLQHLDAVLQRIRTGSVLVRRMRCYASDQEVLDMHGFLRQALCRLKEEEPQSTEATVCVNGFAEVKERLQDLVSGITQGADLPPLERASPQPASTPPTSDVDSGAEVQDPGPAQAQPEAVVQPMPGAHPVPVHAYSIRDAACGEEDRLEATPQKRKACQTESPRKMMRLQSEEDGEAKLAPSMAEQPGPSTSQAVSPPCPEEPPGEDEDLVLHINHQDDIPKEADECILICSSEESDTENSTLRDMDESSSESSNVQLEGPNSLQDVEEALTDPQAEDRPLVFFDLRIDSEKD
ncbi:protein PML isoform X3 [Sorex fumeus]|uniref:protein PML isoform X3 n=1 Tax=Sorex fumeus TaxID=62283 RepID=UPI0024AE8171|nr:protein PML isoform X3 [Sorex fumeus]